MIAAIWSIFVAVVGGGVWLLVKALFKRAENAQRRQYEAEAKGKVVDDVEKAARIEVARRSGAAAEWDRELRDKYRRKP